MRLLLTAAVLSCCVASGQTNFGFNRIIHGWTNYSTAFSITHDSSAAGEYATVAGFYTPPVDVRPLDYDVVFIWFDPDGGVVDFRQFSFAIYFWSSLEAFIRDPRDGDIATVLLAAPTGGSTSVPDAITRGGRPAYYVRFDLSSASVTLTQCHTYVVGVAAKALSNRSGQLFVPTAPFDGPSDLQAGNIVPFGWMYLVNAGGQTIYSGQLATELRVAPVGNRPVIEVQQDRFCWSAQASCYTLEYNEGNVWETWPVTAENLLLENGRIGMPISATNSTRFFRLTLEPASRFTP